MTLAVLSDTHGRGPATAAALAALERFAPAAFPCTAGTWATVGSIGTGTCGPGPVLDLLAGAADGRPVYLCPGNNDRDPAALRTAAEERGFVYGDPVVFEVGGVRVCGTHGTRGEQARFAARGVGGGPVDLVCSGHTHVAAWEERQVDGRVVRLLNPGAVWRARPRTVAVVDLDALTAEFVEVPRP